MKYDPLNSFLPKLLCRIADVSNPFTWPINYQKVFSWICFDQQLWMKVHFRESKESTNCSEFFKEVNISYQCCLNREFERNDSVHLMSVSLENYTFKVAYLETQMWQILAFLKDRSKETVSMSLVWITIIKWNVFRIF